MLVLLLFFIGSTTAKLLSFRADPDYLHLLSFFVHLGLLDGLLVLLGDAEIVEALTVG